MRWLSSVSYTDRYFLHFFQFWSQFGGSQQTLLLSTFKVGSKPKKGGTRLHTYVIGILITNENNLNNNSIKSYDLFEFVKSLASFQMSFY